MRVLELLIARLSPPVPGPPSAEAAARLARVLGAQSPVLRAGVKVLLWLLEYGALLRTGRRFTRLSPAAQEECLRRWERSRLYGRRFAILCLKAMAHVSFFHDARAERAFGYDPASPAPEQP